MRSLTSGQVQSLVFYPTLCFKKYVPLILYACLEDTDAFKYVKKRIMFVFKYALKNTGLIFHKFGQNILNGNICKARICTKQSQLCADPDLYSSISKIHFIWQF